LLPAVLQGPSRKPAKHQTGRDTHVNSSHPAAASGDGSRMHVDLLPYPGGSEEPTADLQQQLSGGSAYGAAQVGGRYKTLLSSPAACLLMCCSSGCTQALSC
jgi:hypothetical protein